MSEAYSEIIAASSSEEDIQRVVPVTRFNEEVTEYEAVSITDLRFDERDVPYQRRTTSLHRNFSQRRQSTCRRRSSHLSDNWINTLASVPAESHVDHIVKRIKEDLLLTENSAQAEQLRREILRDMPQSLAIRRQVKHKLEKTRKCDVKPIGCWKRMFYNANIYASKMKSAFYNFIYTFELWYGILKRIEGQFGSAIAVFFRFYRAIFLLNIFTLIPCFVFVVLPQLFLAHSEPSSNNGFWFWDLFTGEGFLENTTLFYGFYTNATLKMFTVSYVMPYAYLFTMFCIYVTTFLIFSIGMARSYKRNFIEIKGGLKNVFAHKIFCGWDFGIANEDAAHLKSISIFMELRELLQECTTVQRGWLAKFLAFGTQTSINCLVLLILAVNGWCIWIVLDRQMRLATAALINLIILVVPLVFAFMSKKEYYKNPRTGFYIAMLRTFLLELVVVGTLIVYWLTHGSEGECWQTKLGQEIYRLVIFDFFFSVILLAVTEIGRSLIHRKWSAIGAPTFDITRFSLHIIYNQSLFWVGLYFSPLLSAVVIVKLFIMFYLITYTTLGFCKPSTKSFRPAQTQTVFLGLTFLWLVLIMTTLGYIIGRISTSNCGPFRNQEFTYIVVRNLIEATGKGSFLWNCLTYLLKPGVVALILIMMCVGVYYLHAKAQAQESMIELLRNMLIYEAKDKDFLLQRISQGTSGKWQYRLGSMNPDHFNGNQRRTCGDVSDLWEVL